MQFNLMAAIAKAGPVAPGTLARVLDLEKSSLSRNLRPLIDSQQLGVEASGAGGQKLRITKKGRAALEKSLPAWRKAQAQTVARLGGDAVSKLDGMIAALAAPRHGGVL